MKLSYLFSKEVARKMILIHPPEPRREMLVSMPGEGIYLGKTRFLHTPVFWDHRKLINPHVAVVGITGSGKSYLVKSFLTRAALIWDSNAIILDWVGEYDNWVRQAGGKVIDLGKERLNLLDLVGGLPKSSRIKQIVSALDILVDLKSFPHERDEIEEALEAVYGTKRKANLSDVVKWLEKKKRKKSARLLRRFTSEGCDFFSGNSTLDIKKLTSSGLICLDLHGLPTEEVRSLAGLTILQYVKEIMRAEGAAEEAGVRLFIVLDEAWKIAQDERSDVVAIVREGRKYNFALLVATQNPTDMNKAIFSNVGTMFVMRLVLREYRDYVRSSIGYSQFVDNEISKFGVGDAAVNMIFAKRQSKVNTFLMEKIDGEEPLFLLRLTGDGMDIEIEREQLVKMLYELGLTESQLGLIKREFEKGDGLLDGEQFVSMLEKFGYSKSAIISFLRQLGVDERNLVRIFSLVKMRKATKGLVDVVLEE